MKVKYVLRSCIILLYFTCAYVFCGSAELSVDCCGNFRFGFYFNRAFKNKQLKHTVSSFVLASLVSGFILIALGMLQSVVVGVDTTEILSYKIFKLYALLSVFMNEIFIERLKLRDAK